MKLSLVVKAAGKMEGQVLPITLSQFVVGRDPQCHLRPASPMISKRHCAVLQRDGKAYIHDFGSTNGTFLNDQPVKDEVELHDKDRLKIGPLDFLVHLEADAAPAKAAAPKSPTKPEADKAGAAPPKVRKTPPPPSKTPPTAAKKNADAAAAAKEAAAAKSESEDDDIAAMLMSLHDDDDRPSSLEGVVPEGSTVMDLAIPPLGSEDPNKGGEKGKGKDKPKPSGNTSNAAKSILEQYMKRPRG